MRFFKNLRKVSTFWSPMPRKVRWQQRSPTLSTPNSKSPKTKWPRNYEEAPRLTIWSTCLSLTSESNRSSNSVSSRTHNWLRKLTKSTWSATSWGKPSPPTTTSTTSKMRPKTASQKSSFWISWNPSARTQKSSQSSNLRSTLLATYSKSEIKGAHQAKWRWSLPSRETHLKIVTCSEGASLDVN